MSTRRNGNEFRTHKAGSVIAGVQGALPEHRYEQSEITEMLAALPAFKAYGTYCASSTRVPRSTAATSFSRSSSTPR